MRFKKSMPNQISSFLILLSLICFGMLLFSCSNQRASKEPNIVVIVIDTLRQDHLPFYGYPKDTAPFLSKVAARSVVFENAYSVSSWTAPATASIFTSLNPIQHGVTTGMLATRKLQMINSKIKLNKIPNQLETMPEVLKKAGYKTYAVADNFNISEEEGFDQGFDKFITYNYKTADRVNDTLKKMQKEIKNAGKYFLYIHYMDTHEPYHKRAPWFEESDDPREVKISAYDSEINYVDGKIKEAFEFFGWDENTLVIITSDHGEEFYDHGKWGHGENII